MTDIPKKLLNQKVFKDMIGFLTAVSKKDANIENLKIFVSYFAILKQKQGFYRALWHEAKCWIPFRIEIVTLTFESVRFIDCAA